MFERWREVEYMCWLSVMVQVGPLTHYVLSVITIYPPPKFSKYYTDQWKKDYCSMFELLENNSALLNVTCGKTETNVSKIIANINSFQSSIKQITCLTLLLNLSTGYMYCSTIPMGTSTSHLNHFARHWELNITINLLIMILVDETTLPKDFTSQKLLKLCSLTQSRVSFFSLVHAVVVCLYIFFDLLEETKSSHTHAACCCHL